MMLRTLWLLALSLCAAPAFACGDRATYTYTNHDGVKTSLYLTPDDFLGSPAWDPSTGPAPLDLNRAITIALDWAEREHQKYDGVVFKGLSLVSYRCRQTPTYWFYMIDFTPVIDGNEVHGARSWAAVLLDGSVVGPQPHRE